MDRAAAEESSSPTAASAVVAKQEVNNGADGMIECGYCDKKYASYDCLKRHVKSHSNERPYQCDFCPKRFRLSSHRKEHIRIHTGEKPYKCRFCGHAFCQISNMKTHENTHTRAKSYTCHHCGKNFLRYYGLTKHIKNNHPLMTSSGLKRHHHSVRSIEAAEVMTSSSSLSSSPRCRILLPSAPPSGGNVDLVSRRSRDRSMGDDDVFDIGGVRSSQFAAAAAQVGSVTSSLSSSSGSATSLLMERMLTNDPTKFFPHHPTSLMTSPAAYKEQQRAIDLSTSSAVTSSKMYDKSFSHFSSFYPFQSIMTPQPVTAPPCAGSCMVPIVQWTPVITGWKPVYDQII